MNLKKTKWYPVNMSLQIVFIDPMDRARDVSLNSRVPRSYDIGACIPVRGDELMNPAFLYRNFSLKPTKTRESVLAEWKEEVGRSKHLWQGAARIIADTVESNDPQTALESLKRMVRETRPMAICASYMRAVEDIKAVIDQQAQAS